MGYLKRHADGVYRVQYDISVEPGKRHLKRETLKGVTKREATAILAPREAEVQAKRKAIESGEKIKDEVMLAELFESFMKAKRTNKESTTLERYRRKG
jgi:hypothetical protein